MTDRHWTDTGEATSASNASRSRALVVVERPRWAVSGHDRPQADFVAQLIACDRRLPAYRSARLAEPERAISAYGSQPGGAPLSFSRLV